MQQPVAHQFNPYNDNGGTVVAISSTNFALIAADTRQSNGYNIETRYTPRCHQITESVVISAAGFKGDCNAFIKLLKTRVQLYYHDHQKYPDLPAVARFVSHMLYKRRFFPFYSWILLAGIDRDGKGAVYSYDPVGSYERYSSGVSGSAKELIEPFIDNQVLGKNMAPEAAPQLDEKGRSMISLDHALNVVTDAFAGATERQIEVGDGLEIFVIKTVNQEDEDMVDDSRPKIEVELIRRPLKRD